jgi:hypothetical protein
MSTPPQAPPPAHKAEDEAEIKIISHSNLFYWWPVWAVGFLMFLLTLLDNHRMAVVPEGTEAHRSAKVQTSAEGEAKEHEVLVVPRAEHSQKHLPAEDPTAGPTSKPAQPQLHMASTGTYGVIFLITLLLVIVITNVPLRGMWSVVVIISIVLLSVIFGLAGWWERILYTLHRLDVRINAGGYLFISGGLFVIWLVTFLFFDQQMYIVFTPGQLKVRTEIGGGEKAYDTSGMTVEKQRSDLFRHWILGLGSGDLVVNTVGAHVEHIPMPNVLFIGKKVQLIEDMLREKAVVKGR